MQKRYPMFQQEKESNSYRTVRTGANYDRERGECGRRMKTHHYFLSLMRVYRWKRLLSYEDAAFLALRCAFVSSAENCQTMRPPNKALQRLC